MSFVIRRLRSTLRHLNQLATHGGGARSYILHCLGFGHRRRTWIINSGGALILLAATILVYGEGLGIMANAEAPIEAQPVLKTSVYTLGAPVSLREARSRTPATVSIPVTVERSNPFVWPATGPITSYMGPTHPAGIDIGLNLHQRDIIRATAPGIVTYAGGSDLVDYGYHTIVDHGNGITSLYAHLDGHLVSAGEYVAQGQPIGIGGNTGLSTGKHLHFEIQIHNSRIDPLTVLPVDGRDADSLDLDCMESGLMIASGSQVSFDFNQAIAAGGRIVNTEIRSESGQVPAGINAESSSDTEIRLSTALDISGPFREYPLNLVVRVDEGGTSRDLDCELTLRVMPVDTVYYVRVAPTEAPALDLPPDELDDFDDFEPIDEEPIDEEPIVPTETPEPTPTETVEPTPEPTETPTPEPTETPEPTPTEEPTVEPTAEPTATEEPAATATWTPAPVTEGEADEPPD